MQVSTPGIVLQTIKYSESSVIVKIFTQQQGLLSFIVKGVRKKNARFHANNFTLLSILHLDYKFSSNKSLHFIDELSIPVTLAGIQTNPLKSCIAFFLAEVCAKSIHEQEQDEKFFDFLMEHILHLNQTNESINLFAHYFLLQMTDMLGFKPQGRYDAAQPVFDLREGTFMSVFPMHPEFITKEEAKLFSDIASSNLQHHYEISTTHQQRQTLLESILFYFDLHVLHGAKIKSLEILRTMMA